MAETITSSGGDQQNQLGIVNRVKETATARLTSQRDRGLDVLESVSEAVRTTTQKLRENQHDAIAGYVDRAADQIDQWSQRLRDKDIQELITDVQQLARRRPAVFIGSAFALGLLAARFLKSSSTGDVGEGRGTRNVSSRSETFERRVSSGGAAGIAVASDAPSSTSASTPTRARARRSSSSSENE